MKEHKYSKKRDDGDREWIVEFSFEREGFAPVTFSFVVWASYESEAREYAKELFVASLQVTVSPKAD